MHRPVSDNSYFASCTAAAQLLSSQQAATAAPGFDYSYYANWMQPNLSTANILPNLNSVADTSYSNPGFVGSAAAALRNMSASVYQQNQLGQAYLSSISSGIGAVEPVIPTSGVGVYPGVGAVDAPISYWDWG